MNVYKKNNHIILKFNSEPLIHISIQDNYIEYIKQNFPDYLLEQKYQKITFDSLDDSLKEKLNNYFRKSLANANRKVRVFQEALI